MREITNHLTPDEKKELDRQSAIGGIWAGSCGVGFSTAIVCFFDPLLSQARNVLLPMCAVLVLLGLIGEWKCKRRFKAFLCSTEWARAQDRTWDEI